MVTKSEKIMQAKMKKKCGGNVAPMRKIEKKMKTKKFGEKWQKKWRW